MPETTQFSDMGNEEGNASLKANHELAERYRIQGVLGGGGMGTVYKARDMKFPDARRMVAIKEMQAHAAADSALTDTMMTTFQREANILATLSHPAIPKIFDFFRENKRAYLIMEYINGNDLEALLGKTKELPIDKIIEWAIDLCDVLGYLHDHEPPIVFRDMKPSNVMIDNFGRVRLIDFGIAKTFQPGKHTMIGTEGYSSPEQYKGDVSPRSDIYSLGATMHHILTRKDPRLEHPFSFHERPILAFNKQVPNGLVRVIEKAVEVEPANRYQSCHEMKADLEKLRQGAPVVIQTPSASTGNGGVGSVAPPAAEQTDTNGSGSARKIDGMTDFMDDADDLAMSAIEPKWTFPAEDELRGSPVVHQDMVFIGSYDTNMWALNLETGEQVWKVPTRAGIATTPAIDPDNKNVLFGSEDNYFYALDVRTGRVNWKFATEDRVRGSATVAHNHVFFGSDDGHMYALNLANGRKLWAFDAGAPVRSRPCVTEELVIFGSDNNEITALDFGGKRKWSYRTKRPVLSSAVVDEENMCYIGSVDNFLYVLDTQNGHPSWKFRTNGSVISSPALSDGNVFFGSVDGHLYAVYIKNHKERWKIDTGKAIVSSPTVFRDAVYFGGTDNKFYCIDIELGRERWHFTAKNAITSSPCFTDNLILVSSLDHTLYALPLVG